MKQILFVLLIFVVAGANLFAKKVTKAELVFKGMKNTTGNWELNFADKKNKSYQFNAQRSNTEPYVFYSTAADGSLNENEKIKGSWFLVSYTNLLVSKTSIKIITRVEAVDAVKIKPVLIK
jgi:hypothetical protein